MKKWWSGLLGTKDGAKTVEDISKDTNEGNIWEAVTSGDSKQVEALLKRNVDVNAQNSDGNTVLMLAAQAGEMLICSKLERAGSELNTKNNEGNTAAMLALDNQHKLLAKFLLEAECERVGKRGGTSLMLAMSKSYRNGHKEYLGRIQTFLKSISDGNVGAKYIKATDYSGNNALMMAAEEGDLAVIKTLLEQIELYQVKEDKAKEEYVKLTNKDEDTALTLAVSSRDRILFHDFIEQWEENSKNEGSDFDTKESAEINEKYSHESNSRLDKNKSEIAQVLLGCIKDDKTKEKHVNHQNKKGESALTIAVERGHEDLTKMLVFFGANINGKNMDGETATNIAIRRGNTNIVKFLVSEGGDFKTARMTYPEGVNISKSIKDGQELAKAKKDNETLISQNIKSIERVMELEGRDNEDLLRYICASTEVDEITGEFRRQLRQYIANLTNTDNEKEQDKVPTLVFGKMGEEEKADYTRSPSTTIGIEVERDKPDQLYESGGRT